MLRFLVFLALLPACTGKPGLVEFTGQTMGTSYSVKYIGGVEMAHAKEKTEALLVSINREMSTYIADSEISRFNDLHTTSAWFPVSQGFFQVLQEALALAKLSGGRFDPTLGPLVNLWGFGPQGKKRVPGRGEIKKALAAVGYDKIMVDGEKKRIRKKHPSLVLDLSSLAKGWAVDEVGRLLEGFGIENYMVEIGGEVRLGGDRGGTPWEIGVINPQGGSVWRVLRLKDSALATSGNYLNNFREKGITYSHIIDGQTGRPIVNSLVSVTVIDGSTMVADAWATALMAMDLDKALALGEKHNIAALLLTRGPEESFREVSTSSFKKIVGSP